MLLGERLMLRSRFLGKQPMLRSLRGTIHATFFVPRETTDATLMLPKAAGSASLIYKSASLVVVVALDESVQSFSFKLRHHFRIRS